MSSRQDDSYYMVYLEQPSQHNESEYGEASYYTAMDRCCSRAVDCFDGKCLSASSLSLDPRVVRVW